MDLFDHASDRDEAGRPLAERLRPRRLEDFVGQEHVLGPQSALRRAIEADQVPSLLLWGPPGTGKTTLARIVAEKTGAVFVPFSAVLGGVKEIREIVQAAKDRRKMQRQRTILFVDEIHRFTRAQQDAFLPHVEAGVVTLIGATTENPSFEINAALLSRCRVVTLRALTEDELAGLLDRAVASPRGLGGDLALAAAARELFARYAYGDARRALNALEVAAAAVRLAGRREILPADAEEAMQHKALLYDKAGEEHYNVVSAFIKSLRGSDPDAAVYYLVRMLEGGEDPRFILRRMVIFASEDVGNADPGALRVAVDALQAVELVGLPEGVLAMSQAAVYLALAPKSNAALTAYAAARRLVKEKGPLPVPLKLRNAPTALMEGMGYGGGYRYPHNFEGHYVAERYLPDALRDETVVELSESGLEKELAARLAALRGRRARARARARVRERARALAAGPGWANVHTPYAAMETQPAASGFMLLVKTFLAPSRIHGIGLFAAQRIPSGTLVWRMNPAIDLELTEADLASLAEPAREQIRKYTYVDLVRGTHVLCGDDARFFNHDDSPNCHDFPDAEGGTTVAARDIEEGEELTSDYARFDAEHVPYAK